MVNLDPQYLPHFFEIVKKINASLNLHDLLATINRELTELLHVEASAILVYDSNDQELYYLQARENSGSNVSGIKIPLKDSIANLAIQNDEAIFVNDTENAPLPYQKASCAQARNSFYNLTTRNLAVIPLKVNHKAVGVLEVVNKFDEAFKPQDIALLSELALYVAIALENAKLYQFSSNQLKSIFIAFSNAIDKRDYSTHYHSKRVRDYALIMSDKLNLNPIQRENLELAAILHDIGKIGIRDDILQKPSQLTAEEYAIIKEHPVKSAEIISLLDGVSDVVIKTILHHHERWDGHGYPSKLSGDQIPYFARIISICDVFDALTNDRPYRPRKSVKEARDTIEKNKHIMFDPELVNVFMTEFHQIIAKGKLSIHVS
jgi:putative nucleotidyltransferase with HDIG domain